MNSKERVLLALDHKEPDRVPINYRATDVVTEKVGKALRLDYEGILEYFNVDFREVIPSYQGPVINSDLSSKIQKDIWGVERTEIVTDTSRDVMVTLNPLKEIENVEDLDAYPWPKPEYFDFSNIEKKIDKYEGFAVSTEGIHAEGYHGIFHQLTYLFGMEKVMMDFILNKDLINKTIEKITAYFLDYYERLFKAGNGKFDILFYKDDFGSQNGLLISRDFIKEFFMPAMKKLVDLADAYGVKVALHSCGSIYDIIPDIVDIGVKILDPIQTTAKNMEINKLKTDFGNDLTFHGAIDTQELLPKGTPEEVKNVVNNTISVLGKGGGYFFSPSHRLQQDTPTENVLAMYDAVKKFKY